MESSYLVSLGGGIYIDENGRVSSGTQEKAHQVYDSAAELGIDSKKVADAMQSIKDFLEDEKNLEKVKKLGLREDTLKFLLQAAEAGALVASYANIAFLALDVVISLIGILSNDKGLSPEAQRLIQETGSKAKDIDDRLIRTELLDVRSAFHKVTIKVSAILQGIVVGKISVLSQQQEFDNILVEVDSLNNSISRLGGIDWSPLFLYDNYKEFLSIQPWLSYRLPDGTYKAADPDANASRRFYHRLGVPVYAYIATGYPILCAAGLPWYRSAGAFASRLREIANQIDEFVKRMCSESFALTIHTVESMYYARSIGAPTFRHPTFAPSENSLYMNPNLVGAVDIINFSDSWLRDEFFRQFAIGYDTGQRGALHYNWPDRPISDSTDESLVQEANQFAANSLAMLQAGSGMIHLIQAAARLRYLSTPPIESETVTGHSYGGRRPVSEKTTTAKSPWIFPVGIITRSATLKCFDARARLHVRTPFAREKYNLNYRVQLVAVDKKRGDAWVERGYRGEVWSAEYVPASGDPRDRRLDVQIDNARVLDRYMLFEGPPPLAPLTIPVSSMDLNVSTFDWYVPTREYVLSDQALESHSSIREFRSQPFDARIESEGFANFGGTSVHAAKASTMHLLQNNEIDAKSNKDFLRLANIIEGPESVADSLRSEAVLESAEKRWVKNENVTISWSMSWEGDRLTVELNGQPSDRSFQIYIVIEEDVYSGESIPASPKNILSDASLRTEIHTAFPLEIVNQLTLVPAEFFRAERDALSFGSHLIDDINNRYSKSKQLDLKRSLLRQLDGKIAEISQSKDSTASIAELNNARIASLYDFDKAVVANELNQRGVPLDSISELTRFLL